MGNYGNGNDTERVREVTITNQLRHELSAATRRLFLAVPAVGTKLALVKADGVQNAVYGLEAKGGEFEFLANGLAHGLAPFGAAVGILVDVSISISPVPPVIWI